MTKEMIESIIRHLITGVGAVLVTKGYTDAAGLETIAGGVAAVIGLGWSFYSKKKAANALAAK